MASGEISIAPNPFNPQTEIKFGLGTSSTVTIRIYDVRGMLVRTLADEPMNAGTPTVVWEGKDNRGAAVGSGVYFMRLAFGGEAHQKRLLLVK